ncbi:MAG TPA: LamG domain-containing protein [Thermoguttaceae bacterium]|nr:LamG domain-containing protein [Thermoguttaceae bacterium]
MKRSVLSVFSFSVYLLLGSAGAAVAQTADGVDADPHLVGWWKMDDASGKTAADASRHGRGGTLQGGLTFEQNSVAGRVGKALQLDGKEGCVEITGYKGVAGTQPRTVALWIKSKSTRGELLAWGADDFGKMFFFQHIRGRVGVTPSGGYLYINDQTNDDQWHHVAAVVVEGDPPNLHDHVRLYLDGELATIHDIGLLDLWPIETGSEIDVRIGRGFEGAVDEVRIYDRALSDDEVKNLFRQK